MARIPHILVVDDDRDIRQLLSKYLAQQGWRVSVAKDGEEMRGLVASSVFDLIILDVMMPGDDGLTLCRELRAESTVPILMLTAVGEPTDRVIGLEMGADDYMPKPFLPRELLARVKAIFRRVGPLNRRVEEESRDRIIRFDRFSAALGLREVRDEEDRLVPLSSGEWQILEAFLTHPRRVLSRDQLLDLARGRQAMPFDRSIDIQVSRLRRKLLDDAKEPRIIKTVRSGGYIFTADIHEGSDV